MVGGFAVGRDRGGALEALDGGVADGECLLGCGVLDQGVPGGVRDTVEAREVDEVVEGQVAAVLAGR